MLYDWDTVMETVPAEEARMLSASELEKMHKQEHIYSLHPQCPEDVSYIGSTLDRFGYAYDYYRDKNGTYWYDSRPATQPVVTRFRYGGGRLCRKRRTFAPKTGNIQKNVQHQESFVAGKSA